MDWIKIETARPISKELVSRLISDHGKDNLRRMWEYDSLFYPSTVAYNICENAYLGDSYNRENIWRELLKDAKNIYILEPNEIMSRRDYKYSLEEINFHDIAIKNVLKKRGFNFQGKKLIQIDYQSKQDYWSYNFDPGKVPFNEAIRIKNPQLKGYWDKNSIKAWYESNQIIQIKK